MDFKSLLQSMDNISETVHKAGPGGYGNRHGSETQTDQYGKPIGKVSLASLAPKDDKPKKRGRPEDPDKPKTGKDDPKNQKVGDLFGRTTGDVPKGKKGSQHTPMKDADKAEKKAEKKSLKDWIEASEQNQLNEADQITIAPAQQNTQVIKQGDQVLGQVSNPQLAAQIKQALGQGQLSLGAGRVAEDLAEKFDKPVKTDPSEKGKYKGKSKSELLKAYNHLKKTGPHEKGSKQFENMKELAFAIRAKSDWGKVQEEQVEEGGYNPDRDAQQEWNRYAQGDRDFQNQERNAGEEDDAPRYPRTSDRMRQAQYRHNGFTRPRSESVEEAKDLPGNQDDLDIAPPKGELTKADFEALRNRKKVKESISFNEMMDDTHSDMQDMLQELQQDIDHFNATGHCSDKLEAFLKVHGHNKRKITDEGEFTQHYMDANKPSPVRQNAEIAKAPQQHTPWSVDPINAATDRAGNFLKNLGQPKKTFESTNMKDIQLESWEKELNSLLNLNEGITVSSSTGQQGSPDSVSVNATDGDAQQLLQVLRSAGVGVFGGEQEHSDYGAPMNSQEPTGAGSEPEMSPAVVGDGDDMMTLIKKMSGIQDSGEPEGTASSDYESEEGSDDNQVQHGSDRHDNEENKDEIDEFLDLSVAAGNATGGGAQGGTSGVQGVSSTGGTSGASNQATGGTSSATNKNSSDVSTSSTSAAAAGRGNTAGNSLEEENMEEGNKYLYNVLKAKEAGKKQADLDGDGNLEQVKEGSSCNECGMYEARCVCEPGKEQVEEEYANEAGHEEMAQLKHLLSMGNDMHKEKRSQAVGNPQQVTFETKLLKDSTSLLQDFKKLSGIK